MKIVLSWLNELAPVGNDVDAIAAVMNDLGLAVDDIERVGAPIPGVVVAKVLERRKHPNADRIGIVDVDLGDGHALQICCGAFNMEAGDLVPLATIGTVMPDGRAIGRTKMRGEWSNGMLCSSRELGLGDEHGGILILPPDLPLGAPAFEALGIVEDVLFDLDVPRNRPDCWSHLGVARDLAARVGLAFTPPAAPIATNGPSAGVSVELIDGDLCGRFTARLVTGIEVKPSPSWIADRLSLAGMRPINNVVDASNYVMLELGRPNHAYDLAKLGGGGFRIRRARPGETLVTLDDVTRTFRGDECLICDANDVAIGIGGIMGGANTEIDDATTTVAYEQAWFDPVSVSVTAGRLGLRTEASARFERGCDPLDVDLGARRFVELLRETCPGVALHDEIDTRGVLPPTAAVPVRVERVNLIGGLQLTGAEMKALLDPIGYATTITDEATLAVRIPSWRFDSTDEVDVIEEVARQYGYGRIVKTVPTSSHPGLLTPHQLDRRRLRDVLVGLGASEAMANPFLAPGDLVRAGLPDDGLTLANPLIAEESVLRTSLRPGLLKVLGYNASHRATGLSLFEIGHVYRRPSTLEARLPDEREMVAVVLGGRDAFAARAVFDEIVAALAVNGLSLQMQPVAGLHPTRTAVVHVPDGSTILGAIGEVDPDVAAAHGLAERVGYVELDLDLLLDLEHGVRPYRPFSRFPSSDIDLAFVVDDATPAIRIEAALRTAAGDLAIDVRLFDVYRGSAIGDGRRSLAYALRLQATDRTLTDADVAAVRERCIAAVAAVGGVLR